MLSGQERFFAAEMVREGLTPPVRWCAPSFSQWCAPLPLQVREAIFGQYQQEVPYSCEVVVTSFKEADAVIRVQADIHVAAESQKGIVIGKGGKALKAVGTKARTAMEAFFGKKVFLESRVKVSKSWRDDKRALTSFGYLD